jgi:hypothetical protein
LRALHLALLAWLYNSDVFCESIRVQSKTRSFCGLNPCFASETVPSFGWRKSGSVTINWRLNIKIAYAAMV